MTRASAAQEPSMDEILASIRRIIETGNEPGAPETSAAMRPVVERNLQEASGSILARLRPAAGAALSDAPPDATMGEPESDAPSAQAWSSPAEEDDLASRLAEELASEGLLDWAHEAEPLPASQPEPAAQERAMEPQDDAASSGGFAPANTDDRAQDAFRKAVIEDALLPQAPSAEPLVSGRTGELVSASFDELSQAIREGHLRSIEDMAQDILRPMLQEWLDDNLPRLVERLVREEIERVARGGGRR